MGIDGDAEVIEQNKLYALNNGYTNVEFKNSVLNADLIGELPKFDIIIFLSVFHHMLTSSDAYEWNTEASINGGSTNTISAAVIIFYQFVCYGNYLMQLFNNFNFVNENK